MAETPKTMTGQQLIDASVLTRHHAFIRFREPYWAERGAYMRLSVIENPQTSKRSLGPWAHLFSRQTQRAIGEPTPQALLTLSRGFDHSAFLSEEHELWTGELDKADR